MEFTILVVGAGPAGLVLALDLVKHGLKVRIVEKTEEISVGQRGAGIMPRSLELYRALGLLPDILEQAGRVPRIKNCEMGLGDTKVLAMYDMCPWRDPTPSCPYFNPVALGQGRAQRILVSHLEKYGCQVETGTELKSFEQHEDHVMYQLKKKASDGTITEEEAQASYVIGTDGARGVVRKMLGLSFLGETREGEHWVIADVHLKGVEFDTGYWHMWGDFERGLLSMRATERRAENEFWIAIAGHNIDPEVLSKDQAAFTKLVREISGLPSLEITDFITLTNYKISIRMVEQFGKHRVFVAGDAAHAHSFTGGQGMNLSIQDSFNLGWKLALVSRSLAPVTLLDSYTTERLPVIADVLGKTTELLKKAIVKDTGSAWVRGPEMYQLNIHYRRSPIVFDELDVGDEEGVTRVKAGDRAPDAPGIFSITKGIDTKHIFDLLRPTRHVALIFAQTESDVVPFVLALAKYPDDTVDTVVVLPKGSKLADESSQWGADSVVLDGDEHAWTTYPIAEGAKVVIVRPDGYVGVVAKSVEGVDKYHGLIFIPVA